MDNNTAKILEKKNCPLGRLKNKIKKPYVLAIFFFFFSCKSRIRYVARLCILGYYVLAPFCIVLEIQLFFSFSNVTIPKLRYGIYMCDQLRGGFQFTHFLRNIRTYNNTSE